jgi:glycosyl transferase family 25
MGYKKNGILGKGNIILLLVLAMIIYFVLRIDVVSRIKSYFGIIDGFKQQTLDSIIRRDDFDCYVITLKKNEDRFKRFMQFYNMSDLNAQDFIKVDGIYGKEIDGSPDGYKKYISNNIMIKTEFTPGMVGCFLSHLSVFKKITEGKKEYGFIFEDDAKMNENIYSKSIANVLQIIPNDWDMIMIGYLPLETKNHIFEKKDRYYKLLEFWGLQGYIVNKKSAQKLIDLMKPPFRYQIDGEMSKLAREDKLKIYAIEESAVTQFGNTTDIQPASI